MSKPDILSMTLEECRALAESLGEKKFRGEQLYGWMQKGTPLSEMKKRTIYSSSVDSSSSGSSTITC